jgi:FtsP/CotA-like multicopper oxidase with cupredoxin domain
MADQIKIAWSLRLGEHFFNRDMEDWMKKRFSPLLLAALALGISLALAQTQGTGAKPAGTTDKVAQQAADAAQPSTPDSKAESNDAAPAAAAEAEAASTAEAAAQEAINARTVSRMRSTTQAQRQHAAQNYIRRMSRSGVRAPQPHAVGCGAPLGTPCGTPDYFTFTPNYALSQLPTLTQTSIDPVSPKVFAVTTGTGIRKFVDGLPGLGPANKNNLGNYIPVASPIADPWGHTNSDYYEIGLIDYTQKFHTDIPASQVRGYVDLNPTPQPAFRATGDVGGHYLGPVILAQSERPVRLKFTNQLNAGSFLFIPADESYMGMMHQNSLTYSETNMTPYSKNRATVHLHGGVTPWISDGTPHQWTVPAAEYSSATYKRGDSVQFVPDMLFDGTSHKPVTTGGTTDPGPGSLTFYYTNHQSGRLMFYHDHSYGTTRLNVYAGEASAYLLHDAAMDALIDTAIPNNAGVDGTSSANLISAGLATGTAPSQTALAGGLYRFGIPLIIQDKTFVPNAAQMNAQDPTWNWGPEGNLWFPHVYMPNQNPNDNSGATIAGRWDYGMWFWPPMTAGVDLNHADQVCTGAGDIAAYGTAARCPGTRNPSGVPESFMDTPVINGQAYPTVTLQQGAYRFQVLNAANDRMFNMSLFYAADANGNVCNPNYAGTVNSLGTANTVPGNFAACTEVKMVPATPHALIQTAPTPAGIPTPDGDADDTLPRCAATGAQPDSNRGDGFLVVANPGAIDYNPATGLPGLTKACWPSSWPTDGRDGGVPDPASAGPAWVQIGTEGGVLPAPVVIPPTPIGYNYNRRDIVVTNVQEHALFLGPAERADVIVDFSQVPAGSTLILYNDSPAPVPGYDVRLDYYTGDPDLTSTGGAPTTQPGYGPNIRTMMQIHIVAGTTTSFMTAAAPNGLGGLQASLPGVFKATQPAIIIPEPSYSAAALGTAPPTTDNYARIQNTQGMTIGNGTFVDMKPKAIHELFEVDYGKMNSILASELPQTNYNNQTTIPLAYVDPPSEFVAPDQVQLWKVTHNGVDSHAVHFHLFDVQLINRVGWDGAIRPPDPNELGWKETVRMNPLEDAIVALRPVLPPTPFPVVDSTRLLDPSRPDQATNTNSQPGFSNLIAVGGTVTGNAAAVANQVYNFGWEYVWHCHLLGHEESDMMRPIVFQPAAPADPTNLTGTLSGSSVTLRWQYTANGTPATSFMVQRAPAGGGFVTLSSTVSPTTLTFVDAAAVSGNIYSYRVYAVAGNVTSGASNTISIATLAAPQNLRQASIGTGFVIVQWTAPTSTAGETGYALQRCVGNATTCTPGATWTPIANTALTTTNYRNSGLTAKQFYTYRVQATGPGGATSAFSLPYLTITAQ